MSEHESMPLGEVAEYLGVSDFTVQSWAEEGGLVRTAENPFRFTRESVEALKAQLTERKLHSFDLLHRFNAPVADGDKSL